MVTKSTTMKFSISAAAFIASILFFDTVQAGRSVWDGAHVGGQTGWGDFDYRPGSAGNLPTPTTSRNSQGSFVGGFLYGSSIHWGNWVLGTDSTYFFLDVLTRLNVVVGGASVTAEIAWNSETRGRVGYLVHPNIMVFGTLGMAFAKVGVASALFQDGRAEDTAFGVVAGGGIEVTTSARWYARIEYLHANYGREAFAAVNGGVFDVTLSTDVTRCAIGYRFAWSPLDIFFK